MLCRTSTIALAAVALLFLTASLQATVIDPISATATSTYGNRLPAYTIDGSGLSGVGPVLSQSHTTVPDGNMWLTLDTQTATITWDLGALYRISDTHMWNYNETNGNGNPYWLRGVQTADVKISTDGVNYTNVGTETFLASPGSSSYTGNDYSFLNGLAARYVQFNVLSSFGGVGAGDDYTGISEIRFVGSPAPEPASLVLCGLGAVGLCIAARRHRKAVA